MKNSPRRFFISAISLFSFFCFASVAVIAQTSSQQSASQQQNASNAHVNVSLPLRRIVAARTSGAAEGARVLIASDAPLDEVRSIMEKHQIRRVPVVDDQGCCAGIISQADLAWVAPEHEVAELVREVSRETTSESR